MVPKFDQNRAKLTSGVVVPVVEGDVARSGSVRQKKSLRVFLSVCGGTSYKKFSEEIGRVWFCSTRVSRSQSSQKSFFIIIITKSFFYNYYYYYYYKKNVHYLPGTRVQAPNRNPRYYPFRGPGSKSQRVSRRVSLLSTHFVSSNRSTHYYQ